MTKGIEAVCQLQYNTGGEAMRLNTGNGGVAYSEHTKQDDRYRNGQKATVMLLVTMGQEAPVALHRGTTIVRQESVLCQAGEVTPSRFYYRSVVLPRAADCLTGLFLALFAALADDKTSLSATPIAGGTTVTGYVADPAFFSYGQMRRSRTSPDVLGGSYNARPQRPDRN